MGNPERQTITLPSWENLTIGAGLKEVRAQVVLYKRSLEVWQGWQRLDNWLGSQGGTKLLDALQTAIDAGDPTGVPEWWVARMQSMPEKEKARVVQESQRMELLARSLSSKSLYADEDTADFLEKLSNNEQGMIAGDVIREHVRISEECLALLRLQERELLDQIKQRRREAEPRKGLSRREKRILKSRMRFQETTPEVSDQEEPKVIVIESWGEPRVVLAPLSDWQLSWTRKRFSTNPRYLVPIPTDSRDKTIAAVGRIIGAKGVSVPIKPGGVVGALEFHLRKDVIQRSRALRNRFDHPEWAKLKRGAGRIFFRFEESGNTCVFFAGNRSNIYPKRV